MPPKKKKVNAKLKGLEDDDNNETKEGKILIEEGSSEHTSILDVSPIKYIESSPVPFTKMDENHLPTAPAPAAEKTSLLCTVIAIFLIAPQNPRLIYSGIHRVSLSPVFGRSKVFYANFEFYKNYAPLYFIETDQGIENGEWNGYIYEYRKAREGLTLCIVPDMWGRKTVLRYNFTAKLLDYENFVDLALALSMIVPNRFSEYFQKGARMLMEYKGYLTNREQNLRELFNLCPMSSLRFCWMTSQELSIIIPTSRCILNVLNQEEEFAKKLLNELEELQQMQILEHVLQLLLPCRFKSLLGAQLCKTATERQTWSVTFRSRFKQNNWFTPAELLIIKATTTAETPPVSLCTTARVTVRLFEEEGCPLSLVLNFMQSLQTNNGRMQEYRGELKDISQEEYLMEWKTFLSYSDTFMVDVFHLQKFPTASQAKIIVELLSFCEEGKLRQSPWAQNLVTQVVRLLKNEQQRVVEFANLNVFNFLKINVVAFPSFSDLFLLQIDPVCNDDCARRIEALQSMQQQQQQQQQTHGHVLDSIMILESRHLHQFIRETSDDLRYALKEILVKKKYWTSPYYCHNKTDEKRVSIYEHVWGILFTSESTGEDPKQHTKVSAVVETSSTLLFAAMSIPHCCDLAVELLHKSPLSDAYQLKDDTMKLTEALEVGKISSEMLELLEKHGQRLQQMSRKNIPDIIIRQKNSIREAKSQWNNLLDSLQLMQSRKMFAEIGEAQMRLLEKEYQTLEERPIAQWYPPSLDPQSRNKCEHLVRCKKSIIFTYLWNSTQQLGDEIGVTAQNLFTSWVSYLQAYFDYFHLFIVQLRDGSTSIDTITAIFGHIFDAHIIVVGNNRVRVTTDVEKRGEFTRALEMFLQIVTDELKLVSELTTISLDLTVLPTQIKNCLHGLSIHQDAKAFSSIATVYHLQGISVSQIAHFSAADQTLEFKKFLSLFAAAGNALPPLLQVLPRIFVAFDEVLIQQGFLQLLLRSFPDINALNRRIDARQSEDLTDDVGELLTALRMIGQVVLTHPFCSHLRPGGSHNDALQYANFMFDCGSAYNALQYCSGKIVTAEGALQQVTEEKQIIALVKSLLLNGSLVIEIKYRKVTCFGVQQDKTEISPEEFEALPSQLLLTSGVEATTNLDHIDEPLPANISRPEDRERYVQRFTVLFDRLVSLSKIIRSLCETGYPEFQENRLTISSLIRIAKFDQEINSHEAILESWAQHFMNMRQLFPCISCFTRVQLVEWMRAYRSTPRDINALHDTLSAIGCIPGYALETIITEVCASHQSADRQFRGIFEALNSCLVLCFPTEKLSERKVQRAMSTRGIYDETTQQTNGKKANSAIVTTFEYVRLLRLFGESSEEEVVGFHVGQHKRVPFPFEMLFCTSETTSVDLDDFVERWATFHRIIHRNDNCATFYLVHPNRVSFDIQHRLARRISECQRDLHQSNPEYKIQLFLVVEGSITCYITNVFQRVEVVVTKEMCIATRKNIKWALEGQEVYVVCSPNCSSGKTRAVIETLVNPENNPERLHAQISIDKTSVNEALKRLMKERPLCDPEGIVLHFNVGHMASKQLVNVFLLEYILLGTWRDGKGATFPRHPNDIIVIELCNTGYADERDRILITKHFKQLNINPQISSLAYLPHPSDRHGSTYVYLENLLEIPLNALIMFEEDTVDNHNNNNARWIDAKSGLMVNSAVPFIVPLKPREITTSCYSHTEDGHKQHAVNIVWQEPSGYDIPVNSGKYATVSETMLYRYTIDHCCGIGPKLLVQLYNLQRAKSNQMIAASTVESLPIPTSTELDNAVRKLGQIDCLPESIQETFVRRFFSFATKQLDNFYTSFSFWSITDAMEDEDFEKAFYLNLTFQYAMMLIDNSRDLAKPTMMPQSITNPLDDVSRFEHMEGFETWMKQSYFVCTPLAFRVISTAENDPLQTIINMNPRSQFSQWLTLQKNILSPYNHGKLQTLCDQLGQNPYSADSGRPPLKELLEITGCYEGACTIIESVDYLNSQGTAGTTQVATLQRLSEAVSWLNMKATDALDYLDGSSSVCKFKQIAEKVLCRMFGDFNIKPPYRLTVGSILRLVAIQIRNICKIPICILGETGCGKTEMLSFLAQLVGANYHVINVQEGMNEIIFREKLEGAIQEAILNPDRHITCVLDEANATSHVWIAKDMLCDGILNSIRLPSNMNFVVIVNPAKMKSPEFLKIEEEMSVGGLDFRKYQHIEDDQPVSRELVYQVNTSPETLYSLMWDFGASYQIKSKKTELPEMSRLMVIDNTIDSCTDEMQLSLHMVEWLVQRLKNNRDLLDDFAAHGDAANGDAKFWTPFRTLLVELILASQTHMRRTFGGESSSISLRDIRNACSTIDVIYQDFYRVAMELKPELLVVYGQFGLLTKSIHCALVKVYCLRLDSKRRLQYLQEIHFHWGKIRQRFSKLESTFLTAPPLDPATCESSMLYQSFDELSLLIVSDLLNDGEIAPNQALKENTLSMLLAIWMRSTLFIVGRPGSTKSRALELLCEACTSGARETSFITTLGLVIHKFVVQCSPDTTSEHVNSQEARRAAIAQNKHSQLSGERHQCVLVLEEVGATIGSRHNPLMSLHQIIDHGVQCTVNGRHICERLPIIGISNYRLDASKMGRGSIVHRGNPAVDDLAMTAKTILRNIDRTGDVDYTKMFSQAFCYNILQDDTFTWYHGMRDFYASVSTIQRLSRPTKDFVGLPKQRRLNALLENRSLNSHVVKWAMLINLQGYPNIADEKRLVDTMIDSFQLPSDTPAVWNWCNDPRGTDQPIKLCDACCRMQLYLKLIQHRCRSPHETITPETMTNLLGYHAKELNLRNLPCEFFNANSNPAAEIVAYSLWETTSRHQMIFTKANAALPLLFSLQLLRREDCTIIFPAVEGEQATSTSERVQQMMRIKACLREGKTLILVRSRHLYESLLDATNVHYVQDYSGEGEVLYRTMLSMAGVTQSVFIRPSFRCIVLEDRDEIRDCVMPPFINRYSKTTLTFSSILSPQQRLVRSFLDTQGKVSCKIGNQESVFDVFSAIAPGLYDYAVDSAAFIYDSEQEAFERIAYCFSRKNLRRLQLGIVESLDSRVWKSELSKLKTRWVESGASKPFFDCAVYLLQSEDVDDENEDNDDEVASDELTSSTGANCLENDATEDVDTPHLMILTEQLQVDPTELHQSLETIICDADRSETSRLCPNDILLLNQMTPSSVTNALNTLRRENIGDDESLFAIFVIDTEANATVTLDTFTYIVSTVQGIGINRKRVILIVTHKDTFSARTRPFSFVFHQKWAILNTDEVVSRSIVSDGKQLTPEETLEYIEKEDTQLHDILTPNFICSLLLQNDVTTWLCQTLSDHTNTDKMITTIRTVLSGESALKNAVVKICIRSIEMERISFERWATCAFQKSKRASDSLRNIYLNYLSAFCARVICPVLEVLFRFGTIYTIERDPGLDEVAATLLEILLPQYDISHCLTIESLPKSISSDIRVELMKFCKNDTICFPFAPQIAQLLSLPSTPTAEAILTTLNGIDQAWTDLYIRDILTKGFNVSTDHLELLQQLFSAQFPNSLASISAFHDLLQTHKAVFQAARRFVACSLEPLAVETFLMKYHPTKQDFMELTKNISGIPVLARTELLSTVLQADEQIPWKLYRAAGLAYHLLLETHNQVTTDQIQATLDTFLRNIGEGVQFVLSNCPTIAKYFLFEIFEGDDANSHMEDIVTVIQFLAEDTSCNLDDESITCCVGFLLNTALKYFMATGDMKGDLETFCKRSSKHVLFLSHCLMNVLTSDDDCIQLCWKQSLQMEIDSQLTKTIDYCLAMTLLWNLLDEEEVHNDEEEESRKVILYAIIERHPQCIRDMVLYNIRQLTTNGTVELEKALASIRNARQLPAIIKEHPILHEIAASLQGESPLAAIPHFSQCIAALSEQELQIPNSETLVEAMPPLAHAAAVASLILDVSPKDMAGFDIIKTHEIRRHNQHQAILEALNKAVITNAVPASKEIRNLLVHGLILVISEQPHMMHSLRTVQQGLQNKEQLRRFGKDVEEALVPHCPRCTGAILDWPGCFAVFCPCGCGFCGVCMLDCGTDAHEHVQQAHGAYHFTFDRFLQEFGARATLRIRNIMAQLPNHLMDLMANELPRILQDNRYQIRSETILARRNNMAADGGILNHVISPSIRYLFDLFTMIAHAHLRLVNEAAEVNTWTDIFDHIQTAIGGIKESLFPDTDSFSSAFLWVHATMSELVNVRPLRPIVSVVEAQCNAEQLLMQTPPHELLRRFATRHTQNQSAILSELAFDESFQQQQLPTVSPNRQYFAPIFFCRSNFYEHQFNEQIVMNREDFPLLHNIISRGETLSGKNIEANLRIVHFIRDLSAAVTEAKLSKDEAEHMTLAVFLQDHVSLLHRRDEFEKDVLQIFPHVKQYECNDRIAQQFGHLMEGNKLNFDVSLAIFLPRKEGAGIFARSLYHGREGDSITQWTGLGNLQNELVDTSMRGQPFQVGEQRLTLSPYEATVEDIIVCDTRTLMHVLYHLFLVPGFHAHLSKDISIMESVLRYGTLRLAFYSKLLSELPEHLYPLDAFSTLLNPLENILLLRRRGFQPLPAVLSATIMTLITDAPNVVEAILQFTIVTVKQLTTFQVTGGLPDYVRDIQYTIPRTQAQLWGQQILLQIPLLRSELKVDHLRALVSLCWDGKVHASVNEVVPEEDVVARERGAGAGNGQQQQHEVEEDSFAYGFQYIATHPEYHAIVPLLMTDLRMIGMSHCQEALSAGLLATPVSQMLSIEDELYDLTQALGGAITPLTYPMRHFGAIYRCAQRWLGPLENVIDEEELRNHEKDVQLISSTITRQFLAIVATASSTNNGSDAVGQDKRNRQAPQHQQQQQLRRTGSRVTQPAAAASSDSTATANAVEQEEVADTESTITDDQQTAGIIWTQSVGQYEF